MTGASEIRDVAENEIAAYLGRQTAQSAVRIASQTFLGIEPDALGREHVAGLCDGLQPMLRTLLGAEVAGAVLDRIRAGGVR